MKNFITQATAVTAMNLRNLPQRKGSVAVALVGLVGVVAVLVGVMAIGQGFRNVLDLAGATDIVIVLRGGNNDEFGSSLTLEQANIIADDAAVMRDETGALASSELYVVADVPMRFVASPANVPIRGVGAQGAKLRGHFEIVEGRYFTPGTFEMIVGRSAAREYAGFDVGNRMRIGTTDWDIVGIFEDHGSVSESEAWTDASVLQGAYRRGTMFQSVRLKLRSPEALQALKDSLNQDPRLNVNVFTERAFYEEQSRPLTSLVRNAGTVIALLMGMGAICGAINTMYTAVASRTREIATLRAIGFSAAPVVISVLTEAAIIGVIGGVLGGILGWIGFDGIRTSTLNPASWSQITFAFDVTPALFTQGVLYSLALAFIGGVFPGLRAAKLPITSGLREL